MNSFIKIFLFFGFISLLSCSEAENPVDLQGRVPSKSIVVTTVTTDPSTGPGLVTYFESNGSVIRTLKDYFSTGTGFATGSAFVPPDSVLVMVENTLDVADLFNLRTGESRNSVLFSSFLSGAPVRQIAYSESEDAAYILEVQAGNTGTIEKFILGTA